MIMTKDEIVRDYMAAKTPAKQIAILADLNVCTKKEIVEILREAGCELPAYYTKKPKETPEQTKEQKPERSLGEKIEGIKDALAGLALDPAQAEKPLGLQYAGNSGATGGSGRHAEPVVIIPTEPAPAPAPEATDIRHAAIEAIANLLARTTDAVDFMEQVRGVLALVWAMEQKEDA